jgi:aspartate dehydrogenase
VRIGLIGVGAIGRYILDGIRRGAAGGVELVGVADVAAVEARLRQVADEHACKWTIDPPELVAMGAGLVVEAASQAAVQQHGVGVLEAGADLLVMSVGALADGAFLARLDETARRTGRRVHVPSGAIGGLDVLRSARVAGLDEVVLTTSKPPRALAGAPYFAERGIDVAAVRERTVIFDGPAMEAVRHFPANVNVAATVSLAGIGPERTRVRVVADPSLAGNVHELRAVGAFGEMTLRMANLPSPDNPKTSLLACLSPLAALRRLAEPVQVG